MILVVWYLLGVLAETDTYGTSRRDGYLNYNASANINFNILTELRNTGLKKSDYMLWDLYQEQITPAEQITITNCKI